MRSADYAELLEPIDGAFPCGEPLDYDPGFLEFERATRAGPERQAGDQTVAGETQDWRHVAELGVELAGRSKDIRIAVALARAWLATEGFAGLAGGLSLIAGYLDGYWDELHPAPDADDGGDQTIRLNALANLRDAAGLLAEIRRVPLAAARGVEAKRRALQTGRGKVGAVHGVRHEQQHRAATPQSRFHRTKDKTYQARRGPHP